MTTLYQQAGLAASLFILSTPVWAQGADYPQDTIVVTGSRTPVPLSQLGGSSTVIHEDELERRQSVPLAMILRDIPGFAVSQSGPLGSVTQVRVRGAEANHVLFMIDGIEANEPSQGNEFDLGNLLTTEIERVEVIRGPQSALWGSDALAGVVNIITRRGGGKAALRGFVEGGSFGTKHGGANVSGSGQNYHYTWVVQSLPPMARIFPGKVTRMMDMTI